MPVSRAVDEGIRGYTPYTHLLGSYKGGIPAYTNILIGLLTYRMRYLCLQHCLQATKDISMLIAFE